MKSVGQAHHAKTQEIARIEDAAKKEIAVQKQGPPYVHTWMALLIGIGNAEGESGSERGGYQDSADRLGRAREVEADDGRPSQRRRASRGRRG
eukprot:4297450-Pyramimonas_sp.AAC.1